MWKNILMLSQGITSRLHKPLFDHIIKLSLEKNAFLCFSIEFHIVRSEYGGLHSLWYCI